MIKVGDWVEVIGHSALYSKGDRFKVSRVENGSVYDDQGLWIAPFMVRVVEETAAEKRKVKFGDIGSLKGGLTKFTFLSDALEKNGLGETLWSVGYESGEVCHYHPSNIRLDHEPEYKEIPFSEATHEQRMDVSALRFDGGPVEQIVRFDNGEYMFTIEGCKTVVNAWNALTVRIPT